VIWGEQFIRDRVREGVGAAHGGGNPSSVTFQEAEAMLKEIDLLREALKKVKERAWANHAVRKIASEALK
jgi:hypothetical protein